MASLSLFLVCLFSVLLSQGAVLRDFQVAQPPFVPLDAQQCTIQVLQRDFAFSFGSAEVVQLVPPAECGPLGSWAAITLNLTVTSNGTQFDRLGLFTFQNVEIWRTSTPEPTRGDGIIWTYIKDVSQYTPLFSKPGTFIFQLDNLITSDLDGIYSATVHATFYASSKRHPPVKKADLIVPLSTFANDTSDEASVPPGFSLNVTIPQNAVEVYAELFASGNGEEEFWYFNTPNQFSAGLPPSQGPFREVRLLVDGQVAGVVFPYPVIFTGGISPGLWRPITAYGAIDLPTYFIDVTPFVPLLTDGQPHQITIDVASAENDHTILQNWFVSGLLQVITDPSSTRTTGKITAQNAPLFANSNISGNVSTSEGSVILNATHTIHIEADIMSGSGKSTHVVWSQDLSYSNQQIFQDNGNVQILHQRASGRVLATHNGVSAVRDDFSYPLDIEIVFFGPDQSNSTTSIDHSYNRDTLPSPLRLGSTIAERQTANAFLQQTANGNFGNGTSNNTLDYVDVAGNTYHRKVNAALNVITLDQESGTLAQGGPHINISINPDELQAATTFVGVRRPQLKFTT